MAHRIFLAGASGVIGRRLVPLLIKAGHQVTGMGRSTGRASELKALGAQYMAVDVFDAKALTRAVAAARPDVIIHQLTDLPDKLDPKLMDAAISRNARIRKEGTRNLIAAAIAAGSQRFIAQSIAWVYAPGKTPHVETDPLDQKAQGERGITIGGVIALEQQVLNAPLKGTVLRYGLFYGPDTGRDAPSGATSVHVDAAAHAALCALERNSAGVFNIAEPGGEASISKAMAELGFQPDFRL